VACLYCGKEIGPFRILRDPEFCTDAHRRLYARRLERVINGMTDAQTGPQMSAEFRLPTQIPSENHQAFRTEPSIVNFAPQPPADAPWAIGIDAAPESDWTADDEARRRGPNARSPYRAAGGLREYNAGTVPEAPPAPRMASGPGIPPPRMTPWPGIPAAPGSRDAWPHSSPEPVRFGDPWQMRFPAAMEATARELAPSSRADLWMWAPRPEPVMREVQPSHAPLAVVPRRAKTALPGIGLNVAENAPMTAPLLPGAVETPAPTVRPPKEIRFPAPAPGAGTNGMPHPPLGAPGGTPSGPLPRPSAPAAPGERRPATRWVPEMMPGSTAPAPAGSTPGVPPAGTPPAHEPQAAYPAPSERFPGWQPNRLDIMGARHAPVAPGAPAFSFGTPLPPDAAPVLALPQGADRGAAASAGPRHIESGAGRPGLTEMSALPPLLRSTPAASSVDGPARAANRPASPSDASRNIYYAPALQLPVSGVLGLGTVPVFASGAAVEPRPVECALLASGCVPRPLLAARAPLPPPFEFPDRPVILTAGFGAHAPAAAEPEPRAPSRKVAVLRPLKSIRIYVPPAEVEWPSGNIPTPDFIPVDYYLQRAPSTPARRLVWKLPSIELALPGFAFEAVPYRQDETPLLRVEPRSRTELTVPGRMKRPPNPALLRGIQIAACLLLCAGIWLAGRAISDEETVASVNRTITGVDQSAAPSAEETAAPSPLAGNRPAPPAPAAQQPPSNGTLARVQRAISNRAAMEISDSFKTGMGSWGVEGKGWANGWSRSPDGYTRTGDLALFRPAMKFSNYKLEFFGQIETKAMGWVVRAQDKQNYYAMKFKVIDDGLRPVIAIVHYPVVNGRKGHLIETPLSVMVHRNMPFRVAVDVRGSRMTASIDGQQVESWTDRVASAGGVGFFSEAGERARLYWMKISRNQDWLGLVCSLIAGEGATQKAELWGPPVPAGGRSPAQPDPLDIILAESQPGRRGNGGTARARIPNLGRFLPWNC
jgi:hypothetical protein